MSAEFQVVGGNSKAPFTLKVHRGDGMALLAMNWRHGRPPRNFVGFAIEFREPDSDKFWAVRNRIGFPGQRRKFSDPPVESTMAPIQKFRWVHFPGNAEKPGKFTYRITPMFMDEGGALSKGEAQTASIALMRETLPGQVNVSFTRGYVSSQAFVQRFAPDRVLSTLIPDGSHEGLDFTPTHKHAKEAHEWMGFEARSVIHELLDEAISRKAEVRAIAFDLNLPEILAPLVKLKSRLKIIIDDSASHKAAKGPESQAAAKLKASAGPANVKRQHLGSLQHHKSIAVRGSGINKVLFGSTNFSWRGFYVQSNNAVVVNSRKAVDDYFASFDAYFSARRTPDFQKSPSAKTWHTLGVPGLTAKVGYSPHIAKKGLLADVGRDIAKAKSSVLFSLAFLGQTTKGPIGPALGRQIKSPKVHTLGIADANVKAGNLGVEVITPDNKRRIVRSAALTGNVPAPFSTEPSGLSGSKGQHRGTRMHHKFVVIDFDTADARVYFGSYNFSVPADEKNGENLVMIKDRAVATSFMIEAVRLYDHYRFRTVQEDARDRKRKVITLQRPPAKPSQKPWWQKDWDDPIRARDRVLFA
ncbi:MAG TPA: phospholipase D-like domain-containing protein [Vicinamibacterales bacterium]|nr:phospholipase D-like domain-containing protein [Vicinamibacterales bacterium]